MRKTVKILCFGVAMISLIGCNSANQQANLQSYVEIVGTAEKEVEPDMFYLRFNLSETNKTAKNDINAVEQRLLVALKSLNIDTKTDLSVTDVYGDDWYWWRKNRTVYQNKGYLLKLIDFDLLNKTCDKLDSLKVNYYLSKVDYSKMDEIKKEVQQDAVKQARLKAENLLSGENKQVSELIYLQEQNVNNRSNNFYNYRNYDYENYQVAEESLNKAEASPGYRKMKVSYNVIARFSIK